MSFSLLFSSLQKKYGAWQSLIIPCSLFRKAGGGGGRGGGGRRAEERGGATFSYREGERGVGVAASLAVWFFLSFTRKRFANFLSKLNKDPFSSNGGFCTSSADAALKRIVESLTFGAHTVPRSIREEKNSRTAVYMDTHTHTRTHNNNMQQGKRK